MSLEEKLNKYSNKLSMTNNLNKIDVYNKKINKYKERQIYSNLKKPQPIDESVISLYSLKNEYQKNPDKMTALGFGVTDVGKPVELLVFDRKKPTNNEVSIEIYYTGICHSDWHFIVGEWKADFPLIPGHELIGRVIDIGPNVDKYSIGDIVCVSPVIDSCGHCKMCTHHIEQHCMNGATEIYNQKTRLPGDIKPSGPITYGGYSNIVIIKQHFVYKFPKNLDIERCAPLMCAGATTYSPLRQAKVGPGMKVGIVGIGGLGHIAVKIAKAMGAHVVAITRTEWKFKDSVNNLGANESILSTNVWQMNQHKGSFDFILSTIPMAHDIVPYIELLKYKATICTVGELFPTVINGMDLAQHPCFLQSSLIAGSDEIKEMLAFCSEHNIMPDVQIIKADKINDTRQKLLESKAKYRYVIDIRASLNK